MIFDSQLSSLSCHQFKYIRINTRNHRDFAVVAYVATGLRRIVTGLLVIAYLV